MIYALINPLVFLFADLFFTPVIRCHACLMRKLILSALLILQIGCVHDCVTAYGFSADLLHVDDYVCRMLNQCLVM